jgi:hypothetical protein
MSNIAGKAYAMSLVTPIRGLLRFANQLIFWAVDQPAFKDKLKGLLTLSMIHYARWVILSPRDFPRLSATQPRETLRYSYMLFFSNFNGSWDQYVDSFSAAIPSGLNLLWWQNVGWPKSVPEQPFHRYVNHNQLWTNHYYNAYPMAASNDVKAAEHVRSGLLGLAQLAESATPEAFLLAYNRLLKDCQHDLGELGPSPIPSLATQAVSERSRQEDREAKAENTRLPESSQMPVSAQMPASGVNKVA